MEIVNKPLLDRASQKFADARNPLSVWCREMESGTWRTPAELKERFPSASIIRGDLVVFNIKGNHYRLVARINYQKGYVLVKYFDTHRNYDDINVEEV